MVGGLVQKDFGSTEKNQNNDLDFGKFNLPEAGDNLLERVQFAPVQLFANGKDMQEQFWFEVNPDWYNLATQLQVVYD